jgi:hypothetical protein
MAAHHNIPISIADIVIELRSPLSAAALGIAQRLGPFFGRTPRPVARVVLHWEESMDVPVARGTLIYDPGSIWRMYHDGAAFSAAITYHDDNQPAQMHSVLRANAAWNDVTLTEQRSIPAGRPGDAAWMSALNIGAGELLLRTAILFTDGLVLHASGIDDHGQGIVFVGHSGAGKSTQACLWTQEPGVIAMNDDRIAVRVNAQAATCHGTPWGGTADIARNHAAPLRAIILLEQAPENRIEQLAPAVAAPLLLARTFLPYWDAPLLHRALANLNMILARTPFFRLRCRPEKAVIPLVRAAL